MDALALSIAPRGQDGLHSLPGLAVHQRLVLAGILHALERDDALVVGVAQDLVQARCHNGLGAAPWRRWDVQAEGVEVVGQLPHRPVTGRVLRKRQPDEWCAFFIEGDGADFSAVLVSGADVHVAERCFAQRSAIPRLLAHPLHDLISQAPGVELSDAAHDAMQQHAAGGLVDVLAGGDQPHASFLERPVDLHIVRPVAGQPVELVDDDVVDPTIFLKVGQHLLQLGAVGTTSRLTAVGELLDDQGAHRLGLALVGLPLGGEGEALLRPATLGLLTSRDTDV